MKYLTNHWLLLVQRPRRYGKTTDEILHAVGRDPNARQKNKIPNYRNGKQWKYHFFFQDLDLNLIHDWFAFYSYQIFENISKIIFKIITLIYLENISKFIFKNITLIWLMYENDLNNGYIVSKVWKSFIGNEWHHFTMLIWNNQVK